MVKSNHQVCCFSLHFHTSNPILPWLQRILSCLNKGFPLILGYPPKSSILKGFSLINQPFWGIPMTLETPDISIFHSSNPRGPRRCAPRQASAAAAPPARSTAPRPAVRCGAWRWTSCCSQVSKNRGFLVI